MYKRKLSYLDLRINDFNCTDDGHKVTLQCNERYYVPSEIKWLLETANFKNTEIMGCKLGNFSRQDKLTTEDYEMLVVTEK